MQNDYTFYKRVAVAAFVVLLVVAGFYLLLQVADFFLLVFAGILLAVLFCGLTDWVTHHVPVGRGLALLLVVVLVFGTVIFIFSLIAPTVADQADEMRRTIPNAINKVKDWLGGHNWGRKLVQEIPSDTEDLLPRPGTFLSRISSIFSSTLGVLADVILVIITALFFSVNPKLYTHGLVKLFPPRSRTRMLEVLEKCYATLKLWLLAMLLSMTIIGVSTAVSYTLLGLPLAIALAVLSFFLAFIPTIGAYGAAVPAVLVALTQDPKLALYVVVVYFAVQMVETYMITPIIFQKTVKLPPALLLFFQVLFSILLGGLGLLMAAPILAVGLVLIRELYIKDVLEKADGVADQSEPVSAKIRARRGG
ncbi:AI-2E family transporter [Pontibacter ruber]|uniref:AI-2E family transporter n=1 Tax=Pontibacter ruber TaxID=1343895 RepID=A0ABW5CWE3_9BACT|nr:AI-2E family transporter [Pontibacter ruber]